MATTIEQKQQEIARRLGWEVFSVGSLFYLRTPDEKSCDIPDYFSNRVAAQEIVDHFAKESPLVIMCFAGHVASFVMSSQQTDVRDSTMLGTMAKAADICNAACILWEIE